MFSKETLVNTSGRSRFELS